VNINKQNPITWKGKYRAALNNQDVLPRTVDNQLKIWVAVGGTPESVLRAGKAGLPVIFAIIGGNPIQFQPLFQYYQDVYQHFNHDMSKFEVGVHMHCFFGEDSKKIADEYFPVYSDQMNRIGRTRGWQPFTRSQFDYGRGQNGHLIIGDANEAIDKILEVHELFGLTRFSAHMDVGGPSHTSLLKSIEIFGTKIAPKVREALKK